MPSHHSFRCSQCQAINNLVREPVPDVQAIVDKTVEHVINVLLEASRKPERVGCKVLRIHHELGQEREIEKLSQRNLAAELGVSEAAVSTGLKRARGTLARLRDVKYLQNSLNSAESGSCG